MSAMEVYGHSDWAKEVKDFEESKAGVKGLVDSGVTKIPRFFVHPPENSPEDSDGIHPQVPVIDLRGVETGGARRKEIVDEIRQASETWGFFQMVNHGVPESAIDAILEGTRRFHEQPVEAKKELYSSDGRKRVRVFTINGSFSASHVASWRDVLSCTFQDDELDPEAIPSICRKEVVEYVKFMVQLRELLSELLSEALGLNGDFLTGKECMKSEYLTCMYYPACPEPDLALGTIKHSDATFLTLLVQDAIGGLQVLHQNQWIDVPPLRGAVIANIGDLMQLITNNKFKSAEHRALVRPVGPPRVSAACFFYPSSGYMLKPYGPIKELLSEDNPPVYREVSSLEYTAYYQKVVRHLNPVLPHFKL